MPIYEYHCQACGNNFEKLIPVENRNFISCPDCGAKPDRRYSTFSWKWDSFITKDGEGFSSVTYSKQEADERIRANAGKYD